MWVMKLTIAPLIFLVIAIGFTFPDTATSQDFDIRGRIHMDAFIGISETDEFSNGFNNRRARLGMDGVLTENWDGRIELDFADGGVSPNDMRFRRTFADGSRLWLGQFKVPQGLNELTSSNTMPFIERSTVTNMIADARRMGLGYERFSGQYGFKTMIYGRAIGQQGDITGDMPLGGAFRGVFAPQLGPGTLHLGVSVAYEDRMDNNAISLSDRPEARDSNGGHALIGLSFNNGVEQTFKTGLEFAYAGGPAWFEAEYLRTDISMNGGDNPAFYGWHVQTGYVITGEPRSYSTGGFGSVTPAGDTGAWEVALRYSHMDLNNGAFIGGMQSNVTFGVNHYVTSYLRFMANIIFVNISDAPAVDGTISDVNPVITALRAQYHF